LASDAGYGFRVQAKDLFANKKAGKVVLSLPSGARVLRPSGIADAATDRLVAVSSAGRMLVIPASDLPQLTRGKGNKIIGIPPKAVAERSEYVVDILAVPEGGKVRLFSGKRYLNLRAADLNAYEGERGRRGAKLPRGFQKVDGIALEE
jgi:topoisomerase-4 subunit A